MAVPRKILVADDEEGVRGLVQATLAGDDRYTVLLARDGEEALEIAQREKPDLLFLDVVMPKKNGWEVCQELKRGPATAHIKVIMVSALTQGSHRRKAIEVGADDYLTKPFSPTELLDKLVEEPAPPAEAEADSERHEEQSDREGAAPDYVVVRRQQASSDSAAKSRAFEGLSRQQLEIYAREIQKLFRVERHLCQEMEGRNRELEQRMREITSLNHLFQQHLGRHFKVVQAYHRVVADLQRVAREVSSLADRVQSQSIPDLQDSLDLAAQAGGGPPYDVS